MTSNEETHARKRTLHRRLDTIGWGVFFIWIGIAFLADLGWGIGFIGMGLIVLASAAAREYFIAPCHHTDSTCCPRIR